LVQGTVALHLGNLLPHMGLSPELSEGEDGVSEAAVRKDLTVTRQSPRARLLHSLGLPATREEDAARTSQDCGHKRMTHCTCIIFDWDDTLFCTHHMYSKTMRPLEPAELCKLDDEASAILSHALALGMTKIVTNAQGGWVEQASQKHLPKVSALLDRLEVVSARDKFEHKHPNNPVAWKVEAFCAIKEDSQIIANLTAIGDSEAEMVAIREMAKLYRISFFKAVRMKEMPSCLELRKELKLLNEKLEQIVTGAKNYTVGLTSKASQTS